jgi:predicted metal-dependent phosphotriesterase family hydrolase
MTEMFVKDIREGIGDTGVKAASTERGRGARADSR